MATAAKKTRNRTKQIDKAAFSRELFCREYVIDRNATRAVTAAGYSAKTAQGARTMGSRMLQEPSVAARIERLMTKRLEEADITAKRVMTALARIAFAGDMRDLFDADGKLLPPQQWNDDIAEAMTGIDFDSNGNLTKVRRNARDAALGHLARHFKIVGSEIDERLNEHIAVAERLERANARAARMRREAAK